MKKIISASYRDDTPAFFAEEFFADLERGSRHIKNAYGEFDISLKPEDVYDKYEEKTHEFIRGMNPC